MKPRLSFAKRFHHFVDTSHLVVPVWVDVEVHRCGDAGMPKDGAHRLVITLAFDAPGGEAVAQSVEFYFRDVKRLQ